MFGQKKPDVVNAPQLVQRPEPNLSLIIPEDQNNLSVEEAMAKMAIILAETKNPKLLSEIDDREIKLIAPLWSVAERQNDLMMQSFLKMFLELRVSHNRKGRSEIIELAKGIREMPNQRFSRLQQIFGGGNRP